MKTRNLFSLTGRAVGGLILLLLLLIALPTQAQQYKRVMAVLGDSYSTFIDFMQPDTNLVWYAKEHERHTDVRRVQQTWWHQLATENGLRLGVNNSYSGATICNTGYNKRDYSDRSFVTRAKYLGTPDLIVVFGGTNDSWAHSPIGEYKYEGWTAQDLYQFRPAMACLLDKLQAHYPNTDLFVVINDGLSDDITSSLETIATHYGVTAIRLHGIDKQNGHPTVKGMRQIAEQLKGIVK